MEIAFKLYAALREFKDFNSTHIFAPPNNKNVKGHSSCDKNNHASFQDKKIKAHSSFNKTNNESYRDRSSIYPYCKSRRSAPINYASSRYSSNNGSNAKPSSELSIDLSIKSVNLGGDISSCVSNSHSLHIILMISLNSKPYSEM